jgi:DNA mismatch repair protein MutL
MTIKVLPDHVVNCIAAGEVIDRPAAVVRELVDNAVDAGADDLLITIENGGRSLIKVSDNGSGMSKENALLAFERHATSKLRVFEDLDSIATMGFRGEALAAIAAVSKVLLRTRTASEELGCEIMLEAGKIANVVALGCNIGTEIEVRNLYYNTPARRKFLRQPRTEEQRIKSWIVQTALVRPQTRYRLLADGREIAVLAARPTVLDRAREYFKGNSVEIVQELAEIEISGLVAHPALAQADSGSLLIFVNRRLVNDRLLLRAVREGFGGTLKEREYPVGYLCLDLPADQVDVNVHPQKSEVRFHNPQQLFGAVKQAVGLAFHKFKAPIVVGSDQRWRGQSDSSYSQESSSSALCSCSPQYSLGVQEGLSGPAIAGGDDYKQPQEVGFSYSELTYLGQLFDCYLLCQREQEFVVIDMHAAHERINYNRLKLAKTRGGLQSQRLLLPLVVELTETGLNSCIERQESFSQFGFEIEKFGESAVLVRAAPAAIDLDSLQQLVKEIAAIWEESPAEGVFEQHFDQIVARLACHASVRSGQRLQKEEAIALFSALDSAEFGSACPHGRPVMISFARSVVERWFGRDR